MMFPLGLSYPSKYSLVYIIIYIYIYIVYIYIYNSVYIYIIYNLYNYLNMVEKLMVSPNRLIAEIG